jgi:hypothetical protein
MIDLLCRLNREIAATQKNRDDSRRTLGREYDPVRVKDEEQVSAIETERYFSDPPSDSTLEKPATPPLLPQIPTATDMAEQARLRKLEADAERQKASLELFRACLAKVKDAPAPEPEKK